MGIFISKTPTPPYNAVSLDASNPLILTRTLPERDVSDEDIVRCYLVLFGENFTRVVITSEQVPAGVTLLFAKDNRGHPDTFHTSIEYRNIMAKNENKDIVIPFYVRLVVSNVHVYRAGPYIKVEYEVL